MSGGFLEQAWLSACDASCDAGQMLSGPLDMGLDINELSVANHPDARVVVVAALRFGLSGAEAEDPAVVLSATFRLVYQMPPLSSVDERRTFATERALPDLWPLWRVWLHGTLAQMGLAPTPLPAQIPAALLVQGHEAFDLNLAVDQALRASRDDAGDPS